MCDSDASVWREETRRAKKPRRCEECGLPIPIGTIYVYSWGVWDGDAQSHYQHVECQRLLTDHPDEEGCWLYGSLADVLSGDPVASEEWERVKARYAVSMKPEEASA